MKLNERITNGGKTIKAWSSSNSPDLFKYYFEKNVEFGLGGGSNYGPATYLVTEPPYSEEAKIGLSAEERSRLYGDNIYEFDLPTSNLMFFVYDEFLKTKLGKMTNPPFEDFIEIQLRYLKLDWLKPEEIERLKPKPEDETQSGPAINFFKIMSRYYGQGSRGNLRTPCDGFVYCGKRDGNTLVVWNQNRLVPVKSSLDGGATWNDVDKNSPGYDAYMKDAKKPNDYQRNISKRRDFTFDGNPTPEKEEAYHILMAYNSNDGVDGEGKDLGMSDGFFLRIQIHDNTLIDAEWRTNLPPYVDHGKQYFRMKENQFINKLTELGYRFGTLKCGLKIGAETKAAWAFDEINDRYWPKHVTEGLKIVNSAISKEMMDSIPTEFGKNELQISKCEIVDDVFDGWDVEVGESKPCWCSNPELLAQLQSKYDWASAILPEEPVAKKKGGKKVKESRLFESILLQESAPDLVARAISKKNVSTEKDFNGNYVSLKSIDDVLNTLKSDISIVKGEKLLCIGLDNHINLADSKALRTFGDDIIKNIQLKPQDNTVVPEDYKTEVLRKIMSFMNELYCGPGESKPYKDNEIHYADVEENKRSSVARPYIRR